MKLGISIKQSHNPKWRRGTERDGWSENGRLQPAHQAQHSPGRRIFQNIHLQHLKENDKYQTLQGAVSQTHLQLVFTH